VSASPKANTLTLVATCDRTVSVDIPVKSLRDRAEWSSGWKQRDELEWISTPDDPGGAVARPKGNTVCVVCQGDGFVPCEAKGCKEGLVKIERQKAVVAKVEKLYERQLEALRDLGEEDADAVERAKVIKNQLKVTRNLDKKKEDSRADTDGGSWSDYRNARRDQAVQEWITGEPPKRGPEHQQ
jgi:hypothetical protein